MATGHTHPVIDGEITTAQEFAYECSKSFVWSWRFGDELAYPKMDPYYRERLDEAIKALDEWDALDEAGKYAEWSDYAIRQEQRREEARKNAEDARAKLEAVYNEVVAISVPDTHKEFRKFMLDQLVSTMEFDGTFKEEYYRVTPYVEYVENQRAYLLRSVEQAAESLREREDVVTKSRKWISTLASLYGLKVKEPDETD